MLAEHLQPIYLYQGMPLSRPTRNYDYVLAAQGIIKRIESLHASVDALLEPIGTELVGLGLQEYPLQPIRFKYPAIPGDLLRWVLDDARTNPNLEFMYHFRSRDNKWYVTTPQQRQGAMRVGYFDDDPFNIVLDVHSHNTMPAFFSDKDDGDEQGARFYAVMGHVDRSNPELVLRMGMYGHWLYNVPAQYIFDKIEPFIETYFNPTGMDHTFRLAQEDTAAGSQQQHHVDSQRWFQQVLNAMTWF
jgi:PRTRC genetic system protein A